MEGTGFNWETIPFMEVIPFYGCFGLLILNKGNGNQCCFE
jgi:hypothetical protein